jgi:hypothetical protein
LTLPSGSEGAAPSCAFSFTNKRRRERYRCREEGMLQVFCQFTHSGAGVPGIFRAVASIFFPLVEQDRGENRCG